MRAILRVQAVSVLFAGIAFGRDDNGVVPEPVTLEQAAKSFDAAALRVNDLAPANTVRWTGPIYLAIAGYSGMSSVAPEIYAAMRDVAQLARVPIQRVEWGDPRANVRFRPSAGEAGSASASLCRTSLSWNEGALRHAEVAVNLANQSRITRCINHEIMHVFGLRSHAHTAVSVLSYARSSHARPSEIDRLMIEALYDARLPPGTTAARASQIACFIMADKLGVTDREKAQHCQGRELLGGGLFSSLGGRQQGD